MNNMNDNWSQKMGNQAPPSYLDGLQNAEIGHQHRRMAGILDKIQDTVLQENEKEEEQTSTRAIMTY